MNGLKMVWIGLGGVLVGVALPMLMVLDIIQPTFLLGFISFAASVGGLMLGIIGSAMAARGYRKE